MADKVFDVAINVTPAADGGNIEFLMTNTATRTRYRRVEEFSGLTPAGAADLLAAFDMAQKQADNSAKSKRKPDPAVNGRNRSWTGLTFDEAHSVEDHLHEHAHNARKEVKKLHKKHL